MKHFSLARLSVILSICLLFLCAPAWAADRPNILFLFSDDQRADTIGAYDNPHIQTPHLDRLARQGFNFREAHCMGSIHGAVCQPSRAMHNSGRSLYRVPMNLQGVTTLPERLQQAGYVTFGTGKWHNGAESFARSFTDGKSVFLGGMADHLKTPVQDFVDGMWTNKRIGEKFSSELFADATIGFLRRHTGENPFYAYVSFTAPHDPRMPPEEHLRPYKPSSLPLPENFMPQHPFHNGWMVGRDESLAAWPRTPEVIREQLAEYFGMISHMDAQVGRILAALQEAGHADNTFIVFSSDHGLAIGSHGLLGKQNLYEHSMRSPLIIAGPNVPHGESQALVYLFDLYPTICEMAGAAPDEKVEGKSLAPIWQGKRQRVRDTLFTTYEDLQRAVRDDRWKLIRYPQIHKTQLFDLAKDPHELHNLADDPAHAGKVEPLMQKLAEWQRRVDDKQTLTVASPKSAEIDLTGRSRKPDRHQPDWIVKKYFE